MRCTTTAGRLASLLALHLHSSHMAVVAFSFMYDYYRACILDFWGVLIMHSSELFVWIRLLGWGSRLSEISLFPPPPMYDYGRVFVRHGMIYGLDIVVAVICNTSMQKTR